MPRARKVQGKVSRGQVSWEDATTVMVRNVSPKVSQAALRAELHARGFGVPVYDFFYLPMNQEKTANAGYAFVNFRDPGTVQLFVQSFDSTVLPGYPSRRRLQVVPASTQGYEANLSHFAHSAVLNHHDAEHAPLFLRDERSKGGARRPARRQAATAKPAGPRTLAYNLGGVEQKGATVILRLTGDAEGDGAILDSFLSEQSPWHALLATGVDFQHVDSWGTGSATLHFRNEDLAFHFQRAFEHASLLVGAPPIELEVVNAKMPKSPTSFTFTPQVRMPGSPLRSPPTGPPPPPPLEGLADDTLSPSTTPHWLQVNDQRKASLSGATPSSTRSENTVRAVPLDFSTVSLAERLNVSPSKSEPGRARARAGTDPVDQLLSPARTTANTVPGSPFDLPSLLPAPRAAEIPPLPL